MNDLQINQWCGYLQAKEFIKMATYIKLWNHSAPVYQVFQKCANGLREIHPDLNGFDINLEDLKVIDTLEISAQFNYNKAKKIGLFSVGTYCHTYHDTLATMIHEFAHCLNFIESDYIVNKKGVKELGHGKAFREACRRLAKVICNEVEYNLCLITAFDGPLQFNLSDIIYHDGINLYICEKEINGEFVKICTIRELLAVKGIVGKAREFFGIDLLSDLIEHINIQQNLCLDTATKDAEEFYDYSKNIKELEYLLYD